MKRIIISGGGTGGHIYPAITIYKEIMKQNPDAQVLYVGTERGLEATLVPKEGIEFTTLPVQGLQRKLSFGTLVTLGKTAFSLVKANTIISNFKPGNLARIGFWSSMAGRHIRKSLDMSNVRSNS